MAPVMVADPVPVPIHMLVMVIDLLVLVPDPVVPLGWELGRDKGGHQEAEPEGDYYGIDPLTVHGVPPLVRVEVI
jgi:hypothetical protein